MLAASVGELLSARPLDAVTAGNADARTQRVGFATQALYRMGGVLTPASPACHESHYESSEAESRSCFARLSSRWLGRSPAL